jgi:ferredoxin
VSRPPFGPRARPGGQRTRAGRGSSTASTSACEHQADLLTAFKTSARGGPVGAVEVELARTGAVLRVPGDRTIFDVVEGVGVPVLLSCREGTCETAVLSGTPDHRDSVLTNEERAVNDTMMICVSRSPRLVLGL